MKHLLLILLLTISPAACQTLSAPAANALLSYNFARCIAVDDAGRVHVTWYETDRGLVKYRRSVNGAWHDEVVLSGPDAACPAIAVGAGEVLVAWHETTSGRPSVMLRRSTDGGATWAAASSLASGAHVSIAASGQRVLAAWCASPEGQSEIYARRSVDGGRTWDAARRMTDLPHDSWVPSVAVDGENGYLAWVDLRDGNEEEYFKRSTDGGRTWGPDTRVTRNPANSWAPSVAARGDDVYLAWFDQCDSKVDCAQAEEMLNEAMRMVGLPTEPVPTGVYQEMRPATPHQRCEAKWKIASAAIPGWLEKGGDPSRLQPQVLQLQALMDPPAPDAQKEEKLDEILRLLGVPFNPNMKIVSYYEAAIRQRIQDKVEKIQRAAPDWVRGGGDPRRLDAALKSFMARLT
ncbi:MAG: exo-alpha-sialidase, partial [Armatimonadetes bacterium]|nr:exo-alpha-sialidase [Armatimonadota bacterium]